MNEREALEAALRDENLQVLRRDVLTGIDLRGVDGVATLFGSDDLDKPPQRFDRFDDLDRALRSTAGEDLANSFVRNASRSLCADEERRLGFAGRRFAEAFVADFHAWCLRSLTSCSGLGKRVRAWAAALGVDGDVGRMLDWDNWDTLTAAGTIASPPPPAVPRGFTGGVCRRGRAAGEVLFGIIMNPLFPPITLRFGFRHFRDEFSGDVRLAGGAEMFRLGCGWGEFLKAVGRASSRHVADAVVEVVAQHLRRALRRPHYLRAYASCPEPKTTGELFAALSAFLKLWCARIGIGAAARNRFYQELVTKSQQGTGPLDLSDVQYAAARLWTSASQLGGRELCSILAQVDREDSPDLLDGGALTVQRGINSLLVTRRGGVVEWTPQTYRGSGIPRSELKFFEDLVGQEYLAPMPLATSRKRQVASNFLVKIPFAGDKDCVLFTFIFRTDPPHDVAPPCIHVNYLENISLIKGEEEFLFVAYSGFRVREVRISKSPSWSDPHHVLLDVMPDNRVYDLRDLPLARWH